MRTVGRAESQSRGALKPWKSDQGGERPGGVAGEREGPACGHVHTGGRALHTGRRGLAGRTRRGTEDTGGGGGCHGCGNVGAGRLREEGQGQAPGGSWLVQWALRLART